MTATTLPAAVGLPTRPGLTSGRVLLAEWHKAWGLRSTGWAVVGTVLLGAGITFLGGNGPGVTGDGYSSLAAFVTSALPLTQFPLLLLGVLLGSGEHSSRSAGPTFVAVPRRTPVLLAKTLVTAVIAAITGIALLALSTAAAAATIGLGPHPATALMAQPVRLWAGSTLYLVAATVFCCGLGMLLRRSTAAVLVTFVVFVLDLATLAAPEAVRAITDLLPGHTAYLVTANDDWLDVMRDSGALTVEPWTSVAVAALWAAAAVVAAGIRLRGRDV